MSERPIGRFRRSLPEALHGRDFSLLWSGMTLFQIAGQMVGVAIAFQVFAIRHSTFDSGLVPLVQFLPMLLLAIPAGHLADRVSRRNLVVAALVMETLVALALIAVTRSGASELWPFLALAFVDGSAKAVSGPTLRAMAPTLVPVEHVPSAMALRGSSMYMGFIAGPPIGGLLFEFGGALVYVVGAATLALSTVIIALIREPVARAAPDLGDESSLQRMLAGVHFIRRSPVVFGAISLDLLAVLFGGALVLLPKFAEDVLDVGAGGLGVLRAAPAAGALVAGVLLARRPLGRNSGRTYVLAVAVFGASMIGFGLSTSMALSLLMLALSGFADMISVAFRGAAVALATPDELRGRVNGVETIFINASNQLGAFESGVAAALLGPVTAVVAGGVICIGLAAATPRLFPALSRVDRLEDLTPSPAPQPG